MAETEFTQSVAIVDTKTGRPTQIFLQRINALSRGLRATGDQIDGVADGVAEEASDAEIRSTSGDDYVSARGIESASAPPSVLALVGGSIAIDWDAFIYDTLTLDGDGVIAAPSNGQPGTWRTMRVMGNDATERAVTFDEVFGSAPPEITDCTADNHYVIAMLCLGEGAFLATATAWTA